MGAWGYGPFENDTALDFMGGIANLIAERTLQARGPHEVLAGIHALILLGGAGVADSTLEKKLAKRLAAIATDKDFLSGWDDGGTNIKRSINRLIKKMDVDSFAHVDLPEPLTPLPPGC